MTKLPRPESCRYTVTCVRDNAESVAYRRTRAAANETARWYLTFPRVKSVRIYDHQTFKYVAFADEPKLL